MSGPGRHNRVGSEAGATSMPEPDEVRNKRLIALQMEALGTSRKDYISTTDFKENLQPPNLKLVQQLRRSNVPGTREYQESKQDRGQLSAWNNLYTSIEDDGTVDEGLLDFHGGQTHRAKLMQEVSGQRNPPSPESQRGSKSGRGGRAGSGGRGGRNHGHWGPKRTPVGYTEATSGANRPSAGSHFNHRDDPFAGGNNWRGERWIKSTTSGAVPALAASRPSAPAMSQPNTPAAKRPSVPSWGSGLASPETFMAAINRGQSTTPAVTQGATPVVTEAATVTETAPRPDAIANSENSTAANDQGLDTTPAANPEDIGGKLHRPSSVEVIDEVSDLLISTDAGSSHGSPHSTATSPGADRRPSYSNDLIGLEIDSGPGSLAVGVGSNESAEDPNRKASDPTDRAYNPILDLVNEIENLIPVLLRAPDRVPIRRQIDELLAQLKASVAGPSPSSAFDDTELNEPIPQIPADGTPQDQPKELFEEPISGAKFLELTTSPAHVQAIHVEPSTKGKERISEGGKASEEVTASGLSVETNIHNGPANRDEADLTTGAHIMPGQFSRNSKSQIESASSSSETTQKATLAAPTVRSPLDYSVAPLAAGFARLSLDNISRREAAPKLAKVNPFSSGASGPNASHHSATELPLSKPLLQESRSILQIEATSNAPVSTQSQSSGSREASSIIPALEPQLTGSDGSEPDQAPQTPVKKSPFFTATIPPPGGSRINRVGYFRGENQSPGSTRRPTPEAPFQPNVAAPAFQPKASTAPFRSNMSTDTWRGRGDATLGASLPTLQPAEPTMMPSMTTNAPASGHSVFKITHVPSGPSMLNRTGLFKDNQQPTAKK